MSRAATWTKVGQSVEDCRNLHEVLKLSGLDYEVNKEPIYIYPEDSDPIMIPDRYITYRDDGRTYDVVSDKYEIIQNEDAFDFVNYMGDEVTFERAGETAGGMVFIIGSLPSVNILGDEFTPYVIFRNGFSGKITTSAAICPLRIVCQNQFNFAFKDTNNAISIRHVSNAEIKMQEAKETLKMSADYMLKVNKIAEGYAGTKLSEFQIRQVLNTMFPLDNIEDMNPYQRKSLMDAKAAFINAYEADDNYNFRGTAWGIINAYTDFITHKDPAGKKDTRYEGKFVQTTFKPSMNKILDVVDAVTIAA